MNIIIYILLSIFAIFATSCASKEKHLQQSIIINQPSHDKQKPQATYSNNTFVRVNNVGSAILLEKVTINQREISLIDAIHIVMPNVNIIAQDSDVKLSKKIAIRADNLDFGSYLEQLASVSEYHITTDGKKIYIASTLNKTWDLSTLVSNNSVIVNDGEGIPHSNANNSIEEIYVNLQKILGNDTYINRNKKFGTLNIIATVDKIKIADNYLSSIINNSKKQVFFDIKIIKTNISNNSGTGIDFSLLSKGNNGDFGIANSAEQSIDGSGVISIGSLLKTPLIFGNLNVEFLLNILNKQGGAKIINNPSIMIQNGETKSINAIERSERIKSIDTAVSDSGSVTITPVIDELKTGLTMSLSAIISQNNKLITSNIDITLSSIKSWTTLSTGSGASQQEIRLPTLTETDFGTKVMLRPGQTLLIGGIFVESTNDSSKNTDNFLLDSVLGSSQKNQEKEEILILVKPVLRLL